MDAATLVSAVYDAIIREKVGVVAVLTALAALVKTYREKQKLTTEIAKLKEDILESRQRRALAHLQAGKAAVELRALRVHQREIAEWLTAIEEGVTGFYNDLNAAFSPLTRKILKRDIAQRIKAMYDFADTRIHRPKFEGAAASIRRLTEDETKPGITALMAQVAQFEGALKCRSFDLKQIAEELGSHKGLSAAKGAEIEAWVAQVRQQYDELIIAIGDVRGWLALDLETA